MGDAANFLPYVKHKSKYHSEDKTTHHAIRWHKMTLKYHDITNNT